MIRTPNVITLTHVVFPIVEAHDGERKILVLPPELRRLFTGLGAHMVRINSESVANLIPDFGSEASGRNSFLPHKDNFGDDADPKRYLVLSKAARGARGSKTLACLPETAYFMLVEEEFYFRRMREELGKERAYNPKFRISESQYHRCFDEPEGYEAVSREVSQQTRGSIAPYTVRLNILNYLIRGPLVEPLMEGLMRWWGAFCAEEPWEDSGVLIIDNTAVFHLRVGGNFPPLKRNFCT